MDYKPPLLPAIQPVKIDLSKYIKECKEYLDSDEYKLALDEFKKEARKKRRKLKNLYSNICFTSLRNKKKDMEDALDYLCTLSFQKRDNKNEELFIALEAYLLVSEMIARVYDDNPNDEELLQKLYKEKKVIAERKDKLIDEINNPYPFKKK